MGRLRLAFEEDEAVYINDDVIIRINSIDYGAKKKATVELVFNAPSDVKIFHERIYKRMQKEKLREAAQGQAGAGGALDKTRNPANAESVERQDD